MPCFSNMPKDTKNRVLDAIKKSGSNNVTWSDEPDERMPHSMRENYGAIYGEGDASKFWKVYNELEAADHNALTKPE
jgi:hypothetical protein